MSLFKRRRYFIDKKLQTKYIFLTILMLLVYTLLFVVILMAPYIVPLHSDLPLEEQAQAARTLLNLHQSIWPALGTVILIMSGLSIFITHKIAGPVYRFKQVLGEVSNGNLEVSVKLRDRDDLKDLAEDLDAMIGEMRGFVQALDSGHSALTTCIQTLEEATGSKGFDAETVPSLLLKLDASREKMAHALDKYRN